MDISVIIPTFNNCNRLAISLEAFTELEISPEILWELIIINNNSNDSTKEIIFSFSKRLPIKYVEEPEQGTSHAKNAGVNNASGRLIIFTDDDVKPCKNWIQLYWEEYLINPEGTFWGGPVNSEFEVPPNDLDLIWLGPPSVRGLNWGRNRKKLESKEFFIGANWAATYKAVSEAHGFNTEMGLNPSSGKVLIGEETDLMDRLVSKGLTPLYLPNAFVQHFVPKSKMTLEHISSRAEAYGRLLADKALESQAIRIFGIPTWIYRQFFVSWLKVAIKKIFLKKWYVDYLAFRNIVGYIKQIKGK